jgi:hypothetical protein
MRLCVMLLISIVSVAQQTPPAPVKNRDTQQQKDQRKDAIPDKANPDTPRIGRPEAQPEAQSSKTSSYDPTKDYLYRAYLAATIIGVIGAFLGIAAIYHQTRETARSARAAEESIALQKVAQKQWVNISRWSINKTPDRDWVEIGCLISNPTHVPLTLNSITAQVGGEPPSKQFMPQIIAPENPIFMSFTRDLDEGDLIEISHGRLPIMVEVSVYFTDCFGDSWQQTFGRILSGGLGTVRATETKNQLIQYQATS